MPLWMLIITWDSVTYYGGNSAMVSDIFFKMRYSV